MTLRNSRRRQTDEAQSLRASVPRAQDPQCSQSRASRARSLQMQVRTARNAAPERLAVQSVKSLCRALAMPESLLAGYPALYIGPVHHHLAHQSKSSRKSPSSPPHAPIANRPCAVTCTQNLLCRWGHANSGLLLGPACNLLPLALRGPMASLCLDRIL